MTATKARLGQALRTIRAQMRLTLADVSTRTGIAISTLSKVENAQLSLTYDKLVRLSEGLQVDISAFFQAEPTVSARASPSVTARRGITHQGEGLLVATPNYDYRYLCTELARKAMVPIVITIRARSIHEFSSLSAHSGEEFIYILRGTVEVHTEFYEPTVLRPGEAMYIDSTMRHAFLTTGKQSATMLNVCWSENAGHFRTLFELAQSAARRGGAGRCERRPLALTVAYRLRASTLLQSKRHE